MNVTNRLEIFRRLDDVNQEIGKLPEEEGLTVACRELLSEHADLMRQLRESANDSYLAAHPEATPRLNAALAKAQGMFEAAKKDSENPAFSRPGKKSTYADISAVLDAVRAALAANEIAYPQTTVCDLDAATVEVTTHLRHSSGESMASAFKVPVAKKDPQGYGAATTYARRFGLMASLNVGTEDDDGNTASGLDDAPTPEEIADGQKKMADRTARESAWRKLLASFAELGKGPADLDAKLGKPASAIITNVEWESLVQWGKELRVPKDTAKDPDEAARQQVQAQAEKALAKPVAFASYIDRIRAAVTEEDCVLIAAEFVGQRPAPTKGDIAALTRASTDRRRILADAKRVKDPAPSDSSDVPF